MPCKSMNAIHAFAIGDIITTYHKGFWQVTKIERRFVTADMLRYSSYKNSSVGDEYNSTLHYKQILTADLNKPRGSIFKECDEAYCKRVTPEWVRSQMDKWLILHKLLNERNNI